MAGEVNGFDFEVPLWNLESGKQDKVFDGCEVMNGFKPLPLRWICGIWKVESKARFFDFVSL